MTALGDIVTAAQRRCDRINAPWPVADWYEWANGSLQELYGVLTSTYQDYNVKQYPFTLVGGSAANNALSVGPGGTVADFFQPRAVWLQIAGSPTPFFTIPRLESFQERNLFTFTTIVPIYGAIPSRWNLMGSQIEILPPNAAGQAYVLWYVPRLPTFVNADDQIDAFWLTTNGWQEYAVLDVAIKALIREESYETAQILGAQKGELRQRILTEAVPRDISQPASIVDMGRLRNPWAGAFGGSFGDGSGGGFW